MLKPLFLNDLVFSVSRSLLLSAGIQSCRVSCRTEMSGKSKPLFSLFFSLPFRADKDLYDTYVEANARQIAFPVLIR